MRRRLPLAGAAGPTEDEIAPTSEARNIAGSPEIAVEASPAQPREATVR
jgi:hypothetical protein